MMSLVKAMYSWLTAWDSPSVWLAQSCSLA
jgi:hypothetical protein